jgi:hypothetical protein
MLCFAAIFQRTKVLCQPGLTTIFSEYLLSALLKLVDLSSFAMLLSLFNDSFGNFDGVPGGRANRKLGVLGLEYLP